MKKLMEQMAEELSAAFEKSGYDPSYGKVTVSNRAGICGELGADTTLTERFIQMGIDELSVSPTFVLPVRKIVRELD